MAERRRSSPAPLRKLHFESIAELADEVQRIADADRAETLRTGGNWTAGQILTHLAAWIEYGYVGYPMKRPPWFIRWFLRMKLKRMLHHGMPAGVRIPGAAGGTYGADDMPVAAAAARLTAALNRLESEDAPFDSPAFGAMSHADRMRLNLRHAELHLSFLSYGP